MPAHFTYKDALEQDPHLSRMIAAIHTAGTHQNLVEPPSPHVSPPANQSPSCQPFLRDNESSTSQSRTSPPTNEVLNQQAFSRHNRPLSRTESPSRQLPTPLTPPQAETEPAEARSSTSPSASRRHRSTPSGDGLSDGEIDHLIDLFGDLSTNTRLPPPPGISVTLVFTLADIYIYL